MTQYVLNFGDKLVEAVKHIFPSNAEFISWCVPSESEYVCKVQWKLNNDASRPNKMSKAIQIIIPKEMFEDCLNEDALSEKRGVKVQEKFKGFISEKYKVFDPDHNGNVQPLEKWVFSTNILG
jgi:hypothetical protein